MLFNIIKSASYPKRIITEKDWWVENMVALKETKARRINKQGKQKIYIDNNGADL